MKQFCKMKTSRERHKSAPYQGSKKHRHQSVKYSLIQYPKNPTVGQNSCAKKGTLWNFPTFLLLQNIKKNEERTLWRKIIQSSGMRTILRVDNYMNGEVHKVILDRYNVP